MSDWLDAEQHADQALDWYERGRWAEAEHELRKALALNPNQPEWHFNLGLTLEASGRDREALLSFERSVELMPDQFEPVLSAGLACNRLGDHAMAITWLTGALKLEERNDQAYAGLIESHIRLGDHEEAETTFYLAQQMLEQPSAHCFAAIAESLYLQAKFDRSCWCLREALRLDPNYPRLRGRLAAVLASMGKPHRALQMYLRELQDDPGNIETLHDYGDLLSELGREPEAAEKFRRILELEPANVSAHYRLGEIALNAGKYEPAHIEFALVYKLDANYPRIRIRLAEAQLGRNRLEQARRFLVEQLDLHRADREENSLGDAESNALNVDTIVEPAELGNLLLRAEMPAEAIGLLEEAVLRHGEHPELLRRLALAKFQSGDSGGGATISRRIIRLDPTCVVSMHNLALAAMYEDRFLTAAGWISRGLRIDRHDDGLRRLRMRLWMTMVSTFFRRAWGKLLFRDAPDVASRTHEHRSSR